VRALSRQARLRRHIQDRAIRPKQLLLRPVSTLERMIKSFLLLFFKKEVLSFCSFLKKRTKKLLDNLASAILGGLM
jgi:hypothetical protein